MDDVTTVHPVDGKAWITPLCKLLIEGCLAPAEYRVFLDQCPNCRGHLTCEEHARAAREGKTAAKVVKIESLRTHEKRIEVGTAAWVGQVGGEGVL